jgi:hypothetical protein
LTMGRPTVRDTAWLSRWAGQGGSQVGPGHESALRRCVSSLAVPWKVRRACVTLLRRAARRAATLSVCALCSVQLVHRMAGAKRYAVRIPPRLTPPPRVQAQGYSFNDSPRTYGAGVPGASASEHLPSPPPP